MTSLKIDFDKIKGKMLASFDGGDVYHNNTKILENERFYL
jgi:hypothetical protein